MFLLYCNEGERRYGGDHRVLMHSRKEWAFQFILSGMCTLQTREKGGVRERRLEGPVLVVSAPGTMHAYGGEAGDRCEVLVFHFDEAYYHLRHLLRDGGQRVVQIYAGELRLARELYRRCREAKRRTDILAPLVYEVAALELTTMLFRQLPKTELNKTTDFAANKVAEALAWYQVHLARGLNIQEVADAVHVSATHLRRLFHKIRRVSPREAFTRVQFERAKELMLDSGYSLEAVAEATGFESASAFSRAFKKEFGVAPKVYRSALRGEMEAPEVRRAFRVPARG
ncbi:MAG: AraC family transcriptional regulator [Verrucomicrobiales bacterium]|jgi:AraC family transcriptional regulator|nr:AraC family transcriptional regulator [Verrucomicrobiales bacterium]